MRLIELDVAYLLGILSSISYLLGALRHICTPSIIQWAVYFLIYLSSEALGTSEIRDRWVQLRIDLSRVFP